MRKLLKKIESINTEITECKDSFWGYKRRRVIALKVREFQLMKTYLLKTDVDFKQKHFENMRLLMGEDLIFKVVNTGFDQFSSFALQLRGGLLPSGLLLVNTLETNTSIGGFAKGVYPIEFEGIINSLGKINLQMSESKLAIIGGRVPSKYKGTISESGYVKLTMLDSTFEFTGSNYFSQLVCDPFKKDANKRREFFENKKVLSDKMKILMGNRKKRA